MSTKLPIGDTINEAFQFGLHRWGSVLRFAWLPVVVSMVVLLVTMLAIFDFAAFPDTDAEIGSVETGDILRFPLPITVILGLVAYILMFLLFSGVLASIYRLAALGEDRPGVFQLRMDGPAKRVFFAFVILALVNFIVWSVSVTIGLSITGSSWGEIANGFRQLIESPTLAEFDGNLAVGNNQDFAALIEVYFFSSLLAIIPLLYVNVKLVPFAAGSAAENRLWLIGSLVKTTGHFWSMIGVIILLFIALIVTSIVFQVVMIIVMMLAGAFVAQGSGLAIVGAILFFAMFPASIWFSAFFYAVRLSLPAIIYRRLMTDA